LDRYLLGRGHQQRAVPQVVLLLGKTVAVLAVPPHQVVVVALEDILEMGAQAL
jgi:hypothetical protein